MLTWNKSYSSADSLTALFHYPPAPILRIWGKESNYYFGLNNALSEGVGPNMRIVGGVRKG